MSISPVSVNNMQPPSGSGDEIAALENMKMQLMTQIQQTKTAKLDEKTKNERIKELEKQIQQIEKEIQKLQSEKSKKVQKAEHTTPAVKSDEEKNKNGVDIYAQ
ncbi:MAG TPA: FlxA-like family protein [Candidatus Wallbacteria bacterium]|nr:FlxA-like family protein [Candidatus Wallbacteria bacterium]